MEREGGIGIIHNNFPIDRKASEVMRVFFFSSRRRHTRYIGDWSSDVCSSDLGTAGPLPGDRAAGRGARVRLRRGRAARPSGVAVNLTIREALLTFRRAPLLSTQIGRASCRERE